MRCKSYAFTASWDTLHWLHAESFIAPRLAAQYLLLRCWTEIDLPIQDICDHLHTRSDLLWLTYLASAWSQQYECLVWLTDISFALFAFCPQLDDNVWALLSCITSYFWRPLWGIPSLVSQVSDVRRAIIGRPQYERCCKRLWWTGWALLQSRNSFSTRRCSCVSPMWFTTGSWTASMMCTVSVPEAPLMSRLVPHKRQAWQVCRKEDFSAAA